MRSCILLTGMFAPSVGLWFPGIAGAVGSRVILAHALPGMAAKQHLHVLGDVLPSGGPVINAVSCENLQAAESTPRMVSRWAMLVWPALCSKLAEVAEAWCRLVNGGRAGGV